MSDKKLNKALDETLEYMSGYNLSDDEYELVETALLHFKYELSKNIKK